MLFKQRFSYVETAVIDAAKNELPADYQLLLTAQIASITRIQRLFDGKEVDCYCFRWGKRYLDPAIRLPIGSGEVKLATVRLKSTEHGLKCTVRITAINGYFFCMNFDNSPRMFRKGDAVEVTVIDTWMKEPDRSIARASLVEARPEAGRVAAWIGAHRNSRLFPPLSEEQLEDSLSKIEVYLPTDYVELMRHTNGLTIGDLSILGVDEAYHIDTDGRYQVLTTVDGVGVLAVRMDVAPPNIFYLRYDGDEPRDLGNNMLAAVDSVVASR